MHTCIKAGELTILVNHEVFRRNTVFSRICTSLSINRFGKWCDVRTISEVRCDLSVTVVSTEDSNNACQIQRRFEQVILYLGH